jgi:hypothetical protein
MSRQKHRGQQANDSKLFNEKWLPVLNEAVRDLSWLLSRGYSEKSSAELVGNHYRLNVRQRHAMRRSSCSDQSADFRLAHGLKREQLKGQPIAIDGYNLLITIESALAGGIVLLCRDGCYRDIASIHGTYRRVEETMPALTMIGVTLQKMEVSEVRWLLDKPVSNSGRLKGFMVELSQQYGFDWTVRLVNNPDRSLSELENMVSVSSDSWVLDHTDRWYNLHRQIVGTIPTANVIPMLGVEQGSVNKDQGTGIGEQGSGIGEQGSGIREQGTEGES